MKRFACLQQAMSAAAPAMAAEAPPSINAEMTGDLVPTHDPVMIKQGDTYYVFSTGRDRASGKLIPVKTSRDLIHWTAQGGLFSGLPDWAKAAIPGARDM